MDGLRTARVLVLDNEIKEAKLVMEALAKRGIGSVYFSGQEETLPAEDDKLTGIRLAAIDMDLDDAGGDVNVVVPRLIGTMNRLIAEDNGPFLTIAWTKHDDYVATFRERSRSELACPPISIIAMPKQQYGDIEAIFRKVDEAIGNSYPLNVLGFWEQSVHDSSSSVMDIMSRSPDNPINWANDSIETLRLLIKAAVEEETTFETKLLALLATFSSIQLDAVESSASVSPEKAEELLSPLDTHIASRSSTEQIPSTSDIAATLNRRLWFTRFSPNVAPGNIYDSRCFPSQGRPVLPTLEILLEDMGQRTLTPEEKEGWISVAMEVTPLCDYQQGKRKLPRFVCGIAVPTTGKNLVKTGAYLQEAGPVDFEEEPLKGNKTIVWNARYIVSVSEEEIAQVPALVRMRQSNLIDVQAWLSMQGNRPGYLSIRV